MHRTLTTIFLSFLDPYRIALLYCCRLYNYSIYSTLPYRFARCLALCLPVLAYPVLHLGQGSQNL